MLLQGKLRLHEMQFRGPPLLLLEKKKQNILGHSEGSVLKGPAIA